MEQRWWSLVAHTRQKQPRKQPFRHQALFLEKLEDRLVPSGGSAQHVLILSVDGLHQADVADPNLAPYLTNIKALQQGGVTYTNASTTKPSDSFPGTLAYLTGAGPGTTGVYYDDSYSRTLLPPTALGGGSTPGTETQYAENIDKNSNLINGGGNSDASSIDPNQLPRDPKTGQPVYPNQFLQHNTTINTIFDVAHQAGLYTAFSEKHPAYQLADGTDPNAINDFYAPEVNSSGALLDLTTGKTVNADTLLKTDLALGFVPDVSNYLLVDASNDPQGASDPNLETLTNNPLLTEKYDDLKVQAILNEIHGQASHASPSITNPQVPALFGMNFQAVSVAEKYFAGGITQLNDGSTFPSQVLENAIAYTDASVGKIITALHEAGLWSATELYLLAKHGQAPRVGPAGLMADSTLPDLLGKTGTPTAFAVQDDVSLIYLKNQGQTAQAVATLQKFKAQGSINVYFQGQLDTLPASKVIDQILSGTSLIQAGLGNPAKDSTTPDIIVTLHPGYIWVGNPLKFTNKREEHGGFSADDTHVALIVGGGALPSGVAGTTQTTAVKTTQVAVSALEALGLNPNDLTGVRIEHTQALPGLTSSPPGSGSGNSGQGQKDKDDDDQGSTTAADQDRPGLLATLEDYWNGGKHQGKSHHSFGSLRGL
ncbi:MAG: alkaline phosphatase family protein, partial [Planctomycetes bacterium]|nr:alkaline phosphatase family protein [Planctomycetota bacterium]